MRRGVVVGVNGIEVGRLTIFVCLGEGDDGSIDRRSLDDIVSEKGRVAEDGASIIGAKDGEVGTGGDDGGVERCGEFISTGGISDFAVRDDEIGLRETLLTPSLDILSTLIRVPTVPRDRGDTTLDEVALVETEV